MDPLSILMSVLGIGSQLVGANQAKNTAKAKQAFGDVNMRIADQMKADAGERPKMTMPQGMIDYAAFMDVNRRQEMPGLSAMKADVEQAGATTRGAGANLSGADAAAVLLGESQDRMRGLRSIGIEAARYGQQQNMAYAQSLQAQAPWQQQMWQQNELAPWDIARNEAEQRWNMGAQMSFGGADESAAASIMGANMVSQNAWAQQQNPYSWTNQSNIGWGQQPDPMSWSGGNAGINQLGQQQVAPAVNLGSDPYK